MTDLWSFLLQTLTASGVAVLLLVVKALFRDKLSPRWQFGVWALLGLTLLLPAGRGGRYVLLNWPLWLETAKTALTGDYGLTRVLAPVPLPVGLGVPVHWPEVLFGLYLLGAALLLARYALSYFRLRRALGRGCPAEGPRLEQVARVAAAYGLSTCPAVEASGLPTAFICGFFRPVLVLPAGVEVDDKVLLHELLHLKHRDVGWGLLLCLLRCLHWCNPLLWYCFDRAQNDLEALCDQRVLERLEGEARRDYGRILLSMADDRYARAPGTSSMANGGRNIKARIASIARFKRYPAGMALASVCVAVILALPILLGGRAGGLALGRRSHLDGMGLITAMASARTVRCTTAAGALDAYGKAVLDQNGIYRALCAPLENHPALAEEMAERKNISPQWESGLPCWPNTYAGYSIYNLTPDGEDACLALMVIPLNYPPDGQAAVENALWAGVQTVRAERRGDRWVVLPLEEFQAVEMARTASNTDSLVMGDEALPPAAVYTAETGLYRLELRYQTVHVVDNDIQTEGGMSWFSGPSTSFDLTPKPNALFSKAYENWTFQGTFTGSARGLEGIETISYAVVPVDDRGAHPAFGDRDSRGYGPYSGSSSDGSFWYSGTLEELTDWDGSLHNGGGSYLGDDPNDEPVYPVSYLLKLTINGETEIVALLPKEGGTP